MDFVFNAVRKSLSFDWKFSPFTFIVIIVSDTFGIILLCYFVLFVLIFLQPVLSLFLSSLGLIFFLFHFLPHLLFLDSCILSSFSGYF